MPAHLYLLYGSVQIFDNSQSMYYNYIMAIILINLHNLLRNLEFVFVFHLYLDLI